MFFEILLGVFRIRLQCGKSGRVSRMTLGLVKNASNH